MAARRTPDRESVPAVQKLRIRYAKRLRGQMPFSISSCMTAVGTSPKAQTFRRTMVNCVMKMGKFRAPISLVPVMRMACLPIPRTRLVLHNTPAQRRRASTLMRTAS